MLKKIFTIFKPKSEHLKALYKDGGQVQIACPYCREIQISFSTMDLYLNPPNFLDCEFCGKRMKIAAT